VSSVGSFFSYVNDARPHEPKAQNNLLPKNYCKSYNKILGYVLRGKVHTPLSWMRSYRYVTNWTNFQWIVM